MGYVFIVTIIYGFLSITVNMIVVFTALYSKIAILYNYIVVSSLTITSYDLKSSAMVVKRKDNVRYASYLVVV